MIIQLRLMAGLKRLLPESERARGVSAVQVSEGTTLGKLLESSCVADTGCKVILVNGRYAKAETVLSHDDIVSVFPPVAGG